MISVRLTPKLDSTQVDPITLEWMPTSFANFMLELSSLKEQIVALDGLPLFRGQRKREWRLDSTLARHIKSHVFGIPETEGYSKRLAESRELHDILGNLLLLKFGTLLQPSPELQKAAQEYDLDDWFELMKRYQQYADEDVPQIRGTNLIDWSSNSDVALYFANEAREGPGALYVCNASATGKSLQTISVNAVLDLVRQQLDRQGSLGAPLLFCPKRQIANSRPKNQSAVYFAQMDMRFNLEQHWRFIETAPNSIIVKLILPAESQTAVTAHLQSNGVNQAFIYPDCP